MLTPRLPRVARLLQLDAVEEIVPRAVARVVGGRIWPCASASIYPCAGDHEYALTREQRVEPAREILVGPLLQAFDRLGKQSVGYAPRARPEPLRDVLQCLARRMHGVPAHGGDLLRLQTARAQQLLDIGARGCRADARDLPAQFAHDVAPFPLDRPRLGPSSCTSRSQQCRNSPPGRATRNTSSIAFCQPSTR